MIPMTEKSRVVSLEERGNVAAESISTSRLFERHSRGFILKEYSSKDKRNRR